MALKRFANDKRLWLLISLILFILPWFIFECGKESGNKGFRPSDFWVMLFSGGREMGAGAFMILVCTVTFGLPALVFGWLIHCLVIILRDAVGAKRLRSRRSSNQPMA